MILIDANILISAAVGHTRKVLDDALHRRLKLVTTDAQLAETVNILERKAFASRQDISRFIKTVETNIALLQVIDLMPFKDMALERLHGRAAPDWPLLAAAMMYNAAIWSHDRDFFGVGVPLWSTRNMRFAQAE